jgi:hypothetical protein
MATTTTINNSPLKKFWVVTKGDVCPSLLVATMTTPWAIMSSRWSTPASTLGWLPSKRHSTTSRTSCISTPSGKQKWETASLASSSIRSRRTTTGATCSTISTSTYLFERLQQQLARGRSPHLP